MEAYFQQSADFQSAGLLLHYSDDGVGVLSRNAEIVKALSTSSDNRPANR